jgi:hypothetical protein
MGCSGLLPCFVHGGCLNWAPGIIGGMASIGVAYFFTVHTAVYGVHVVSSASGYSFYAGVMVSGVGTCIHSAHRAIGRVAGSVMMAKFEVLVALISRVGGIEFHHSSMFI